MRLNIPSCTGQPHQTTSVVLGRRDKATDPHSTCEICFRGQEADDHFKTKQNKHALSDGPGEGILSLGVKSVSRVLTRAGTATLECPACQPLPLG